VTEEERQYLRRRNDDLFSDQIKSTMRQLDELKEEIKELAANLAKLENTVSFSSQVSATKAVEEMLKVFGLSLSDQKELEELRATLRFSNLLHRMMQRLLMAAAGAVGVILAQSWILK